MTVTGKEYFTWGPVHDWLCNDHGWQISNSHLKAALGIRSEQHWPDEGITARFLGNVEVLVLPAYDKEEEGTGGWSTRALCKCPSCGERLNCGRLHQHALAKHPVELDAAKRRARND